MRLEPLSRKETVQIRFTSCGREAGKRLLPSLTSCTPGASSCAAAARSPEKKGTSRNIDQNVMSDSSNFLGVISDVQVQPLCSSVPSRPHPPVRSLPNLKFCFSTPIAQTARVTMAARGAFSGERWSPAVRRLSFGSSWARAMRFISGEKPTAGAACTCAATRASM